jgi:hypothetical protein
MRERQIPLASISKKKDNGSCFFWKNKLFANKKLFQWVGNGGNGFTTISPTRTGVLSKILKSPHRGGGLKSFFPTCFWCASFGKVNSHFNSGGRVCCRLSPDNQPRKPDLKKWGKDVCSQATACGATITRSCNTINHLFSPFFSAFCFSDSSVSCVDHWTGKLLLALMFCLAFIWSGGKNWKLAYFETR